MIIVNNRNMKRRREGEENQRSEEKRKRENERDRQNSRKKNVDVCTQRIAVRRIKNSS